MNIDLENQKLIHIFLLFFDELPYAEIGLLKEAASDENAIQTCLDRTEELQTKKIAFAAYMGAN